MATLKFKGASPMVNYDKVHDKTDYLYERLVYQRHTLIGTKWILEFFFDFSFFLQVCKFLWSKGVKSKALSLGHWERPWCSPLWNRKGRRNPHTKLVGQRQVWSLSTIFVGTVFSLMAKKRTKQPVAALIKEHFASLFRKQAQKRTRTVQTFFGLPYFGSTVIN